ncbi:hypothetical protein [Caballeronia sp. AZ10_KS36]|uniref:hypothetical protein n=1 Tax=Caballeronia sp. AZ10_KS36 TaxID=2921757 RepID=UPI002027C855|nr:hypothetical protein [Caballeronia sp. AZ10_KS36]
MSKLIVREVRAGDLEHIAEYMRPADVDEVEACTGQRDALPILRMGAEISHPVWTIEVAGEPAGIFGAVPADGVGSVWMLGTHMLERAPKQLTKLGCAYVRRMAEQYGTLANFVDARNAKSIHWLARLGFTVEKSATQHGALGLPFYRFWMKNNVRV